jgi:DNA-binding MarR family transcriptional regulator
MTTKTVPKELRAKTRARMAEAVIQAMAELVRQQLAERSEDTRDRRRSWVSLTERGAQLVGDRREQREAQFLPRLNRLSDERLRGLQRGLEALITAMREEQQK